MSKGTALPSNKNMPQNYQSINTVPNRASAVRILISSDQAWAWRYILRSIWKIAFRTDINCFVNVQSLMSVVDGSSLSIVAVAFHYWPDLFQLVSTPDRSLDTLWTPLVPLLFWHTVHQIHKNTNSLVGALNSTSFAISTGASSSSPGSYVQ